jgi:hypothetical protein
MLGRISARVRRHISPHHPEGKVRIEQSTRLRPQAPGPKPSWQTLYLIDNKSLIPIRCSAAWSILTLTRPCPSEISLTNLAHGVRPGGGGIP